MPRNDSGAPEASEFELILGNKQLLSVFFIVVVLLGVFFTMGYMVGRNSAPVGANSGASTYERGDAPSAMPVSKPQQTPPVISEQAPVSEPVAAQEEASTAAPPAPVMKPVEAPVANVNTPRPGQYLQVVSVARPQADALAEVLAKRGFRAFVAPGPDENTFRVLVGPAADIDHLSRLKTDLEAAGMKPFPKKY